MLGQSCKTACRHGSQCGVPPPCGLRASAQAACGLAALPLVQPASAWTRVAVPGDRRAGCCSSSLPRPPHPNLPLRRRPQRTVIRSQLTDTEQEAHVGSSPSLNGSRGSVSGPRPGAGLQLGLEDLKKVASVPADEVFTCGVITNSQVQTCTLTIVLAFEGDKI